ncbi:MAG: multidrug ABC transporter ATP-binding protein [Nitrospinaceae bacterium]|nr:MAG: multidrug ABC transporter ATP-binding protein [Nitrospinaceae bacterium]
MAPEKYSDAIVFGRILREARPYWKHLGAVFLLGLLAAPLALLLPVPLKIAVDSVLGTDPLPGFIAFFLPESISNQQAGFLVLAVVLQILVVFFIHLNSAATYVFQTYVGERMTLTFRERLFRHLQRLSFMFHDSRGTADSIYRIQYDAPSIQYITIYSVIPMVSSLAMLVAMIYVTARINLELAFIALGVCPLLFLMARLYNSRMRNKYIDVKEMESGVLNIVQEVMTGVRLVKAFGREEKERNRFVDHSRKTVRARVKLSFAEGMFGLLINLGMALGTAAVLFIGIRSVQAGNLTIGELLMVLTYLAQLYAPLESISDQVAKLQDSLASAQRAFELLDEIPDVVDRPHAKGLKRSRGNVEVRKVSFAYNSQTKVLNNISFKAPPGTRVGISGRTGAGKTTLVSLLTRFYDPDAGQILLDGEDLRNYKITDLRHQFSMVLQEPVLFSTSIEENIAYGRPEASQKEIETAAKAANAHEFITALPEGYATLVGERGMSLSGGERQRISLARAFLKDAPILILDEPTSSVDIHTEAGIMDAIELLMEGRTTFLIAHRLSTLDHCDLLLEIQTGGEIEIRSCVSSSTEVQS